MGLMIAHPSTVDLILRVLFLFGYALLFALAEIEIEGAHGWAERLPTWFRVTTPGARIYDVAYAAWTWVPLFSDRDSYTLGWKRPNRPRRLRLFADAYGLIPRDRHRLVRTIRKRIVDHVEGIRRMAAAGDPAFVRIVHKGHLRRPMRDLRLLDYERHTLEYALR